MNETYVTVVGNVVADPDRRVTQSGAPFVAFRVASTVRRRNRDGEFVDGATSYYGVTAFRALGFNVGNSVRKGDPVLVHGRQRVNQWQRSDGTYGTSIEIDAYHVGHDLSRGTSAFTRLAKSQMDASDRLSDAAVQAAHEEQHARVVAEQEDPAAEAALGNPESDDYQVAPEPADSGAGRDASETVPVAAGRG